MLQLNFSPFPELETERLLLRNLSLADKEDVFAIRSNPTTMQYIPRPLAKNMDDAIAVIDMITTFTAKNERINWGIVEKATGKLIGIIGYVNLRQDSYRGEVGYVLNHLYHRKGFGYEALQAALDYGFKTLQLHSIEAIIRPKNTASIKLVEKAGFVKEAYFKDYFLFDGRFLDQEVYSLITPLAK